MLQHRLDFGPDHAGSRELLVFASKRLCPVAFPCWNVSLARGFFWKLPCSAGIVFSMFFLFDFGCEAAGSRERRFWVSKRFCFIRFLSWNAIMARGIGGLFSQSCSRARRGSSFQCNFFRFDFGSIFGSIKASPVKKGIEKGFEEESKLENRN